MDNPQPEARLYHWQISRDACASSPLSGGSTPFLTLHCQAKKVRGRQGLSKPQAPGQMLADGTNGNDHKDHEGTDDQGQAGPRAGGDQTRELRSALPDQGS